LAAISDSNYGLVGLTDLVVAEQKMRFLPGVGPKKPFNKSLRSVSLSLDRLFFISVGHKLELLGRRSSPGPNPGRAQAGL